MQALTGERRNCAPKSNRVTWKVCKEELNAPAKIDSQNSRYCGCVQNIVLHQYETVVICISVVVVVVVAVVFLTLILVKT